MVALRNCRRTHALNSVSGSQHRVVEQVGSGGMVSSMAPTNLSYVTDKYSKD
jgi:hypothetical protein